MIVKEIEAKAILSKSQIYDYALNAYVGCQHSCVYCYAKFPKLILLSTVTSSP